METRFVTEQVLFIVLLVITAVTATATTEDSAFLVAVPSDVERHIQSRTVHLTCIAYGAPLPNVTWTRLPNTVLDDSKPDINITTITNMTGNSTSGPAGLVASTLTLCDLQLTMAGEYRCEASNGVTRDPPDGSMTMKDITLIVIPLEPPQIVLHSSTNLPFPVNETARMVCSATGVPDPTITWFNSSGPVANDSSQTVSSDTTYMNNTVIVTSVLEMCSVSIADVGEYRCVASNERGNDSVTIRVGVQIPASLINDHGREVEVERGKNITLNCTADGHPLPTITWWRNGVQLTDSSKYSITAESSTGFRSSVYPGIMQVRSELTIISTAFRTDDGSYTCWAQSDGTNTTELETPYELTVIIKVPPTIVLHPPSNAIVPAGMTARLVCAATGIPTPAVTWKNSSGADIANNTNTRVYSKSEIINNTVVVTTVLTLCSIRIADAGNYHCMTGNNTATTNIQVQVKPEVDFTEGIESVEQGEDGLFVCVVDGHPLPVITWWKDGAQLNDSSKYSIMDIISNGRRSSQYPGLMQVKSELTILNVTRADSGNYSCGVQSAGSNETELLLLHDLVVTTPAKISNHSTLNQTRNANSSLSLLCSAVGFPTPTIVWRNSAGLITNDSLHTVLHNPSTDTDNLLITSSSWLKFPALRISQRGDYMCCAGDDCVTFIIQVQVPARLQEPVTTSHLLVNGTNGNSVTISCTADGYPRPVITWYKNGTLLLNISKFFPRDEPSIGDRFPGIMQVHSTLLIRELSTADEGDYTCRAKSEGTNETELQRPYQLTITRPSPRDDHDPCTNVNCNHGTCIPLLQEKLAYTCKCKDGFTSQDCSTKKPPPNGIRPTIVTQPKELIAQLFGRANLTCEAEGFPVPFITWYKDGKEMNVSERSGNHLLFDQISLSDRGFYHCLANNSKGSIPSNVVLVNIKGIVQYKISIDVTASSRRRKRENDNRVQEIEDRINRKMVGLTHEGAKFFSAKVERSEDDNSFSVIITFMTPNGGNDRLRIFVNEQLMSINVTTRNVVVDRFDGCPQDTTGNASRSVYPEIEWPETNLGETRTENCPCGLLSLDSKQLVATRYCSGNFSTGAQWDAPMQDACSTSRIATRICELSDDPPPARLSGLVNVSNNTAELKEFEVTASVTVLTNTTAAAAGNETLTQSFLTVVDNINQVDDTILQSTQTNANTTAKLLDSVMVLTNNLPIPENSTEPVVITKRSFAVSVQRIEPGSNSDSGLVFSAVFGENFEFMSSNEIDSNDLKFEPKPMSTGSITLPKNILNQKSSNDTRVAFSVFVTSSLFQTRNKDDNMKVGSVIISATIVGSTIENLTGTPVKITLEKNENLNGSDPNCTFWDQLLDSKYGGWSDFGCEREKGYIENDTTVTCRCNHLTSFAILLDVSPGPPRNKTTADVAFSYLTYIGVSVSIVALLATIATYLYFKKLRTKDQGQLLLLLCFALLGLYVTFILSGIKEARDVEGLCVALAALIQYFMLVTFMSMLAESINLYMKIVVVLGSQINYYVIKAYIVCWVVPVFVVLLTLIPGIKDYYNNYFCIPKEVPFYIGTIVPVVVIYVLNLVMYVIIFASLVKKSRQAPQSNGTARTDEEGSRSRWNYQQIKQQFIAAMSLAALFGIGWGFGFFATRGISVEIIRRIMEGFFIGFVTLQGLFVFLFQCIYSKAVRDLWIEFFGCKKRDNSPKSMVSYPTTSRGSGNSETLILPKTRGNNNYIEMDCKEKSGSPDSTKYPENFQSPERLKELESAN